MSLPFVPLWRDILPDVKSYALLCGTTALAGLPLTSAAANEVTATSQGAPATMVDFIPQPTLAGDLRNMTVVLDPAYVAERPRLLFDQSDLAELKRRTEQSPELWERVLNNANRVVSVNRVPTPEAIREAKRYWEAERLQSASLAWYLTRDTKYRDGLVRWMLAYSKEPIWGTGYRPNLDLAASWYLYHLAIAYDTMWLELSEAERTQIRDGIASHARALYDDHDPADHSEQIRYDQNHTYIPTVALIAASLALMDEVPEAQDWLNRSYAILRRSRYVLGEDGYYHEGFGYWTYALHWQVRGAELLSRATGEHLMELPAVRDTWMHALYLSLPGFPHAFDIGDTVTWKAANTRPDVQSTNHAMLWAVAAATRSGESQTVGNLYSERKADSEYAAAAFLWFDPTVDATPLEDVPNYHYFADHGLVTWRSDWSEEATCYLFRCGPPLGHRAAEKLPQFDDWKMNLGHVHPDIGAFWMYAKGTYLAVDTGFLAEKWTKDHNTLLIDGKGQGVDGSYWNERGVPYEIFNNTRIDSTFLSDDYGFASGEFGSAYSPQVAGVSVRRTLLMTERWLLVIDDMAAKSPHKLTWLCHADAAFEAVGSAYVAQLPDASLAVVPLSPITNVAEVAATVVSAGRAPGKGVPQQRGHHLALTTAEAVKATRMINLLVPLGKGASVPVAQLNTDDAGDISMEITWPDGQREQVKLDLAWKPASADPAVGPATFTPSK